MENAAEALKMAAAVLIFVLALSISINAFGQVRQTSQIILDYNDREYDYIYVEENRDNQGNVVTERWVGIETIIPTVYKAYKENYKIIFNIGNEYLFQKKNTEGGIDNINYIDLEKEALGSENDKREFIGAVLYGASQGTYEKFSKRGIILKKDSGIYHYANNKKLKESLGVYYQEEITSSETNTPDSNKTKKRVITYSIN